MRLGGARNLPTEGLGPPKGGGLNWLKSALFDVILPDLLGFAPTRTQNFLRQGG